MAKRLEYIAGCAGPASVRRLISDYCLRFGTSQTAHNAFSNNEDTEWNWEQVYVIAAHTCTPGVIDAIDSAVDVHRGGRFSAELRMVQLQGSVQPLGRIDLDEPVILLSRRIGEGHTRCRDNVQVTNQHQWGNPDRFREIKRELLSLLPESLWPDRTIRVKKNPRIGMIHPWGIGFGDLHFEIDLDPSNLHFQLHFGKRKDLCVRVAGPIFDNTATAARALHVIPAELDNENRDRCGSAPRKPNVCAWVLKWHLDRRSDDRALAERFAMFVKTVHPIVNNYIW